MNPESDALATSTSPATASAIYPRSASPHPIYWVIALALVVIAVTLIVRPSGTGLSDAVFAQPGGTAAGSRGVFAFSGQLTKNTYGIFMVDVDTMTLWGYEYQSQKGCMRLVGARTWRYDRYLENHNICDLPPDAVEQMIEEQRKYRLENTKEEGTP